MLAGLTILVMAGGGGGSQAAPRVAVAGVLAGADGSSSGPAVVLPRIDCAALAGQDLSGTPGAAAVIGSATPATSPDGSEACEVKGTAAPQIQFDVFLPTKTWRQRWRNANARHPDVLAAQRRERARIRSERQQRCGRPRTTAA